MKLTVTTFGKRFLIKEQVKRHHTKAENKDNFNPEKDQKKLPQRHVILLFVCVLVNNGRFSRWAAAIF